MSRMMRSGFRFRAEFERGAPVSHGFNDKAVLFEVVGEGISESGFVFNDENGFRHEFVNNTIP